MINPKEVGARLNMLRQERGMSQQAIAALMNVTHQAVSKWETGAALPDIQTILALSKLYRLPMEELLMGAEGRSFKEKAARPLQAGDTLLEIPAEEPAVLKEGRKDGDETAVKQDGAVPKGAPNPEDLPPMSFEEMVSLLPFLDTDTVDAMLERASDSSQPERIAAFAPFASSEALSRAAVKLKPGSVVAGLYPFLKSDMIDDLFMQAVRQGREEQVSGLAPFASELVLTEAFKQAQTGSDVNIRMLLLPFLPGGFLNKLPDGRMAHAFRGFDHRGREERYKAGKEDDQSRAALALREHDDEWIDEHAESLSAQALYKLCVSAGQGEDIDMLLEYADEVALRELLQIAAHKEKWALVSQIASALK